MALKINFEDTKTGQTINDSYLKIKCYVLRTYNIERIIVEPDLKNKGQTITKNIGKDKTLIPEFIVEVYLNEEAKTKGLDPIFTENYVIPSIKNSNDWDEIMASGYGALKEKYGGIDLI